MTALYHELAQPYRIQKRLALNECFKRIQSTLGLPDEFAYITFGGEDLYDVIDLVSVFSIRDHRLSIISFEQDAARAAAAKDCRVATTLSQIESVGVTIVESEFPNNLDQLRTVREKCTFVYFLDYTGTFKKAQASQTEQLLFEGLLRAGDFVLITSCLSPRIVHDPRFMKEFASTFRLFFDSDGASMAFKERNHVDLLFAKCCLNFADDQYGQNSPLIPQLIAKFRYRDTRAPMGLWGFHMIRSSFPIPNLPDVDFEAFPKAFSMSAPSIPDIFDGI